MKNIFFLAFTLLGTAHASAGEAELAIIMDLDESETATATNLPTTHSLVLAIMSERCPIITNRSLLQAVIVRKERFLSSSMHLQKPANEPLDSWATRYWQLKDPTLWINFLCSLISLEKPFWSVYADPDSPLIYLIPKNYQSSQGIALPKRKIDSLKDFLNKRGPAYKKGRTHIAQKIIAFFSPFYNARTSDSAEYAALPQWDIFMNGHGAADGSTIAGIPGESFYKLVSFFNSSLKTRFLFYITCYSGGSNLEKLLNTVLINDSNRFTLATNILADTATYGIYVTPGCTNCWEPKHIREPFKIEKKYTLNFLFDSINDWFSPYEKNKKYSSLRQTLEKFTSSSDKNFIRIKPPYVPWLAPDDMDARGLFIDKKIINKAVTQKDHTLQLDENVQYIVVATPEIPIPIVAQNDLPKIFFASVPEESVINPHDGHLLFKGPTYIFDEIVIKKPKGLIIMYLIEFMTPMKSLLGGKYLVFVKKITIKRSTTEQILENVLIVVQNDSADKLFETAATVKPTYYKTSNTAFTEKVETIPKNLQKLYDSAKTVLTEKLKSAQKNLINYEKALQPAIEGALTIRIKNDLLLLSESLNDLFIKLS